MTICGHEKIIRQKINCERGNTEFEFCKICGQLLNIFPSKKLYVANYPDHDEIKKAQELRKEHQKTVGTDY